MSRRSGPAGFQGVLRGISCCDRRMAMRTLGGEWCGSIRSRRVRRGDETCLSTSCLIPTSLREEVVADVVAHHATAIDDARSLVRSYPSVLGLTGFTVLGLSSTALKIWSIPDPR